jgi:hypothetical protein
MVICRASLTELNRRPGHWVRQARKHGRIVIFNERTGEDVAELRALDTEEL